MTVPFIRMVLLFVAAMACGNVVQAQTVVVINASRDNTLYEDVAGATSNGAGEYFFVGRTGAGGGNKIRRGVIAFNFVDRIPPNATITNVTLSLNMSRTIAGATNVSLRRVTENWGEGTSNAGSNEGTGAPATTNDATWIHRFFSGTTWATAGGTFSATSSASVSVGAVGRYTWGSTAGMVSDVQQWVSNSATNFGWALIGDESAASTAKRFDSKENITVANRPQLTVTYTTPNSVDDDGRATSFALEQNFPNPFNPSTTIEFQVPTRSRTTLKIFNLLGQQVAELVNGTLAAGAHSVQWNAGEMSSGVYVYRLESGGAVATRKLVLAR